MNKAHSAINWENYPSDETPLNESNLNKMDAAIGTIDNRVITLETTKATKTEVATLVADVTFEESTGIITVIRKNGSVFTIDTQLEKIAVNFTYDPTTEQIILTLIDGTKQYIDLSALITQYEFLDTDTVAFIIGTDGKVSAIVKEGSIEEKHLEPNYLAKIKVEVAKAQASQEAAEKSEINAKASAEAAKTSETAAAASETNAKSSETAAAASETAAKTSEGNAKKSETAAATSETNAKASEEAAEESENNARDFEQSCGLRAEEAENSATTAGMYKDDAEVYSTKAQSYAVGGTGSREGEDADNAKYYYEQVKDVSEGIKGGLQPRGTVAFADLPQLDDAVVGWMFNISDEFTTTDDFKEGAGNVIPAGSNIYKTSDEKWDVLAGTPVTGIKGVNETAFRRGNVTITPENIGAVTLENVFAAIYPVGSIYMSATNVNPQVLFGGTWKQIKDRFLLSAGDAYKAGDTGGEATHKLTAEEMPTHGHSYSGNTGNQSAGHTHGFSATTGTVSANHTHSGTTSSNGQHSHTAKYTANDTASGSNRNRFNAGGSAYSNTALTNEAGQHTHTFTTGGISANHTHGVSGTTGDISTGHTHSFSGNTGNAGSGAEHNNMPPYMCVYVWKRTA